MSERQESYSATAVEAGTEIDRFTDSYASFDRIINGLQRQYIQLKEEFSAQNEQLIETNRRLVEMTARNLTATEFLNSILHSISAGVIAVNQDGRITHFNPAASVLLGIPLDVPPGKHYRDIELYDHRVDPRENTNIAYRPENAALVGQLTEQLHAGWRAVVPH